MLAITLAAVPVAKCCSGASTAQGAGRQVMTNVSRLTCRSCNYYRGQDHTLHDYNGLHHTSHQSAVHHTKHLITHNEEHINLEPVVYDKQPIKHEKHLTTHDKHLITHDKQHIKRKKK